MVTQWAGLMAPPMSAWLCTVVFFWSGKKLYICLVYTWWMSFETAPVTGSLVSVADNLRTAEFDTFFPGYCRLFYSGYPWDSVFIEDGEPACSLFGADFTVQLDVPWNAPKVFVKMDSAGLHELDIENMPDVLGLRVRQPEAAVICVMTGRDSWSVQALVPDGKVLDRGFHDVTLVDRYESRRWTRGPSGRVAINVAGASRLRHVRPTM